MGTDAKYAANLLSLETQKGLLTILEDTAPENFDNEQFYWEEIKCRIEDENGNKIPVVSVIGGGSGGGEGTSIANNSTAGLVKGSTAYLKVQYDVNGIGTLNGLEETLSPVSFVRKVLMCQYHQETRILICR